MKLHDRNLPVTKRSRGATMIETIIVFPVILFVGMAIVHLALIYQAKTNLDYAAFMGAKVAASRGLHTQEAFNQTLIEIRHRMAASDDLDGINVSSDQEMLNDINGQGGKIRLTIVRPTMTTFEEWGDCTGSECIIPNDNLVSRNAGDTRFVAGEGNLSIQDANILTLRVEYFIETGIPFMQPLNGLLPGNGERPSGMWIQADATIIMQTEAIRNDTTIGNYTILP